MILDQLDQRGGQRAAAADRATKAIGLREAEEHIDAEAGALLFGTGQVLADEAREKEPDALVLEGLDDDVVATLEHGRHDLLAFEALIHHGEARAHRGGRRIESGRQHRHPFRGGVRQPHESVGVLLAVARDIGAGTLPVTVDAHGLAVLEDGDERHVGEDVFEAVFRFQPELVVLQQRITLDEDMRHAVLVVQEARNGQFPGDHAAAEMIVALQNQHGFPRRGEIGGGRQSVMARADGYDIEIGRHGDDDLPLAGSSRPPLITHANAAAILTSRPPACNRDVAICDVDLRRAAPPAE